VDFVDKIRARVRQAGHHDDVPAARRLSAVDRVRVQSAVAAHYRVDPQTFRNHRGESISRGVAAWLSRQLTSCTLRELAAVFGPGHADSVRNLTRRVDRVLPDSSKLRQDLAAIRQELLKTERIWPSDRQGGRSAQRQRFYAGSGSLILQLKTVAE